MVVNTRTYIRWRIEQLFYFIEFCQYWVRHVNCSDPMDHFGVSVNRTSTDLNRYIGFAPNNIIDDKCLRF